MKQIELTRDLRIDQLIRQAQDGDLVLTRRGHAVALLSEIDDEDLSWYRRERDPKFLASIARARNQLQEGKGVSHRDLRRKLGIGNSTVRRNRKRKKSM
jgi:hypothetical protein